MLKVTTTIKDDRKMWDSFVKKIMEFNGKKIMVGYFDRIDAGVEERGQSVLTMAFKNEFGQPEEMIPDNGPIRMAFDKHIDDWTKYFGEEAILALLGGKSIQVVLENLGKRAEEDLRKEVEAPLKIEDALFGKESDDEHKRKKERALSEGVRYKIV